MRHFGPGLATVAGATIALSILASCSGGHGSSSSTTSTAPPAGTSSTAVSTTTAPASTTSSTTVRRPTTTTAPPVPPTTASGGSSANVRITDFRVTPSSPISCNAPTMIELTWTSSGANQVTLSVDGKLFATFGPGPQDHLEYFACDGRSHTYTLRAQAGGSTATSSTTVSSRRP